MVNINVICPVCKNSKIIKIPEFNHESSIITISFPKGLICEHHFQAFLDRNYNIRGYQKVDIELKKEGSCLGNKDLIKQLKIEGNTINYHIKTNELEDKGTRSLKTIYNEFWEFIDEDNSLFNEFIKSDDRRKQLKGLNELKAKTNDFNFIFEKELLNNNNSN